MTAHNIHVKGGNCAECDFPLDEFGDCTNSDCDTNLISEEEWQDIIEHTSDSPFEEDDEDEDETDEYELGVD